MSDPIIFQITLSQLETVVEYSMYASISFAYGMIGFIVCDILLRRRK